MFKAHIGRNMEVYVDNMLVKIGVADQHLIDLGETFEALRNIQMKWNQAKCAFELLLEKFLSFMVSQRGIEPKSEKIRVIIKMQPP
jgi:hypothetical protein